MSKLLVVEDERKLLRSLQRGLEAEGFGVATASDGEEARNRLAAEAFDCMVLDWMLPKRDGLEVLSDVRRGKKHVPVLMLTARDAVEDRVYGLDAGADDYLVKPFAFAELVARIRSLLRRGKTDRETFLKYGDLEVDLLERSVTRAGHPIDLRSREYEVLVYLLRHHGRTVSRDRLGRDVWHEPDHALTNVIDVTMTNLRKALDRPGLPPLVQTVRGVGFVLRAEP